MTNGTLCDHASKIVGFIVNNAKNELAAGNKEAIAIVLAAYNEMQEDERSGVDYIFNINDKEDLKYLVDKELIDASDIAYLYNHPEEFPNGLFYMNECTDGMQPIKNLAETLINWLEEITKFVILYVGRGNDTAYQAYYERFFVDKVWQLDYFYNVF